MSRVANYLQEHLDGEVTASLEARRYFATDASILRLVPDVVVYPRSEEDIRKVLRFSWQLAERGPKLSVTARGRGTDCSGGSIGKGLVMVFGPHMDHLLELDPKRQYTVVAPSLTTDRLLQALHAHGLDVPALSIKSHQTIGGAIGKNSGGQQSVKYGAVGSYVERLRVVLANGEVIEAKALDKKELSQKLGLSTLEGEIYRELDTLLEENGDLIAKARQKMLGLARNSAGYNLFDVNGGSHFSLVPLLAGSQGTLAITTEATLRLNPLSPNLTSALVSLGRVSTLSHVLPDILKLEPAVCEIISQAMISAAEKLSPGYTDESIQQAANGIYLLVEFDDPKDSTQKSKSSELAKIVSSAGGECVVAASSEDQAKLQRLFEVNHLIEVASGSRTAPVPVANCAVPTDKFPSFIDKVMADYKAVGLEPAVYGHAGEGILFCTPPLELGQLGDRQKFFKLQNSIVNAALKLGGTSSTTGDGRVLAHTIESVYGPGLADLMKKVKTIFDPHGILNDGVKFGTSERDVRAHTLNSYQPHHKYE